MSEFPPDDPLATAFGRFHAEVTAEITTADSAAVRSTVRRRRRVQTAGIAFAATLFVAAPLAAYATITRTPNAPPNVAASADRTTTPTNEPQPTPSVVPTAASLPPRVSGVPGTIQYISRAGQAQPDLIVIGPDGKPQTRSLTVLGSSSTFNAEVAAVSPDGRRIAWIDGVTGYLDIADIDGTQKHTVKVKIAWGCGSPVWSPDSKQVVVTTGALTSGNTKIETINADGSGRRVVDAGGGCYPIWSADGQSIAHINGGKLVIVGADGTRRRVVQTSLPKIATVRTVLSVSRSGKAIVDVSASGGCGCDEGTRRWYLQAPHVIDLNTGVAEPLKSSAGTVWSAFYGADGSMVLRIAAKPTGQSPGKLVFLGPTGSVVTTLGEPGPQFKQDLTGYVAAG
jgi:hypothetical protein